MQHTHGREVHTETDVILSFQSFVCDSTLFWGDLKRPYFKCKQPCVWQ